ncbi:MAG: AhpC/TSA family protein [Flavobacteriales bacterium]|jgi:thiol-disulfide isomerase/thioredoxin|nr:AhpC/TSA family protein [Flavobacteriales bacterium]
MKKVSIIFSLILLSIIASCGGGKTESKFNTNIAVEYAEADTAILIQINPKSAMPIDTLYFTDNRANYGFDIDTPGFYSLIFNNKKATTLFLEKGDDISIKSSENEKENFVIKGSETSQRIEQLFYYQEEYQKKLKEMTEASQADMMNLNRDSFMLAVGSVDRGFKKQLRSFIEEKPNSPAALLAIYQGNREGLVFDLFQDVELFESVHKNISEAKPALKSHLDFLKKNIDKTIAPNFTLPDTKGKQVSLKEYEGNWIFVDFWASWCKPCRAQNPELVKIHKEFPDLKMVSVSLDGLPNQKDPKKEWLKAIKKDKLSWVNLSDLKGGNTEVVRLYEFQSIPMKVLINPQGKIVLRNGSLETFRSKLNEAFNK